VGVKRQQHSAEFKARAMASLSGEKTLAELSAEFGVRPTMVSNWNRHLPSAERRAMIAPEAGLSVSRQCALLGIARSGFYHRPKRQRNWTSKRLDRIFANDPVYGSRRLQVALLREGIIDWATRRVLSWRLSNTLTAGFCVAALNAALARFGNLGIFNTDQGAQFTSDEFTKVLRDHEIEIGMDGRGRCHDNIFVERLWWTVKHEWVYLRPAANGIDQKRSLAEFFDWYIFRRPHQSLDWRTPNEAYLGQSTTVTALAA
jgi:transposase InsO family protein